MSRLKEMFETKIVPEFLKEDFKNKMAVPKLVKVVINIGIGKVRENEKLVEIIKKNLAEISGQMPAVRKAKKAISGFKVREGDEVGLTVTLRGERMYDFMDKLANVTLPRVRDFRGLNPKSFDKNGNFTLGIKENVYFPEVSHNTENIHGLEVTIVSTAKNPADGQKLLTKLGLPFGEQNNG
jgi:large subunit ribosomal protein L5